MEILRRDFIFGGIGGLLGLLFNEALGDEKIEDLLNKEFQFLISKLEDGSIKVDYNSVKGPDIQKALKKCSATEVVLFVYHSTPPVSEMGVIDLSKGPAVVLDKLRKGNSLQIMLYDALQDSRILKDRTDFYNDFTSTQGFTRIFSERRPNSLPFLLRFCKENGDYVPSGSTPCGFKSIEGTEEMYRQLKEFYQEQKKLRLEGKVSSAE